MEYKKTTDNTVKRGAKRAQYNKEEIHKILDKCNVCYIAFMFDGKPFVQPISYGRKGEKIYIHGSIQNRMTSAILNSKEVCLNVTILDGMLLTRSAFHHSVNYRSVVIFGEPHELLENEDKLIGLKAIINHFVPDRWNHCRKPNKNELKATRVIAIDIINASAKIKNAPPEDNPEDLDLDFWAGTIPVKTICEMPVAEEKIDKSIPLPKHIKTFYESY